MRTGLRMQRTSWVLLGILAYCVSGITGVEEKAHDLTPKIDSISLFKNGLGFVSSSITLTAGSQLFRFREMPAPTYGTFWISYPNRVNLRRVVSSIETNEYKTDIRNLGEYLLLNAGRKAVIRTISGDVIQGIVLPPQNGADPSPSASQLADFRIAPDPRIEMRTHPDVLFIQNGNGVVAINASSVARVDFDGGSIVNSNLSKVKTPSLRMELAEPAGGEIVTISYLARGITWAPSYQVDLSDPKTAKVRASAVIINELADLEDVKLELITGFPNIKFGEVFSPTAMTQNLAGFLNSLANGRTEARGSNAALLQQQSIMVNMASFQQNNAVPDYSTAVDGTVSEDLFLYPAKSLSLKKGENAWLPLFAADMPYQHIYTWHIQDFVDQDERYRPGIPKEAGEVWHSCRLTNTLKMPLTTAAAEFTKDGQFTGQDVCYYTASGAETTIRINRAMNVTAEEAEHELERVRNATSFYGNSFDLVKVKGELRVKNRLDRPATLEITKDVSGEILKMQPIAKDEKSGKGLKQVNPKHLLTWQLEIMPGQEVTAEYAYQLYIRN